MIDLFDIPPEGEDGLPEPPTPPVSNDLRDYQRDCLAAVCKQLESVNSTLYVMATGTGKTHTFAHLSKTVKGRVLILAHRQELIYQAKRTLQRVLHETPEIEMADQWSSGARIIISTIQTQGNSRGGRRTRFQPSDFDLVIADEAHHACADSWKATLNYYRQNPKLKIVGCTATPDRADEEALGQIFESVAYEYELPDAIRDAWLVPIHQTQVFIESLDFSQCRTTAGDLNGSDLAAVMEFEKNIHAVADPLYQIANGRQTLVFTASVAHADRLSEILNRHKPACSQWICGETSDEKRIAILEDFADRKIQFLCNCAIATEGFDCPGIEVIGMARPTKSRSLYAQMLGRGTRPLPGLVDPLLNDAERRAAIAASSKPCVEIVDFVGNCGRHALVSTVDVLGGKHSPETVARAKEMIAEAHGEPCDSQTMLDRAKKALEEESARAAEAQKRALILGKATFTKSTNKPFMILGIQVRERGWDRPATPEQHDFLAKHKFDSEGLSTAQAQAMISEVLKRYRRGLCSVRQAAQLKRNGFNENMTRDQAKVILDILAQNHWQWPKGMAVPGEVPPVTPF